MAFELPDPPPEPPFAPESAIFDAISDMTDFV